MKLKINYKLLAVIVFSAAVLGFIFNYFYPEGITLIKQEDKLQWAEFKDTVTVKKSPGQFFKEIPPINTHYLSESKRTPQKSKFQLITLSQTYSLFISDSVLFIDARDKWDYADGHIPGAINIPSYNFEENNPILKNIPKEKTLVLYCGGDDCDASLSLAKKLQKLKYSYLYIFKEGWEEWTKAGYKTEKSSI